MINTRLLLIVGCLFGTFGDSFGDEVAIRKMIGTYITTFNKKDLKAVGSFWSEDSTHRDRTTGERTDGRKAIVEDIAQSFQQWPNSKLTGTVDRVQVLKSDVATVEGTTTWSSSSEAPIISTFSAVMVRRGTRWQIASLDETTQPQPESSMQALQELEWLVGQWVDESEAARVETKVQWSPDKAFLLRSFLVQPTDGAKEQGTQVIGWDPRAKRIRSWTFNSDGSFGNGTWSKNGEQWLIRSSQTLSDGRAASGTFVVERLDGDTISLQLIGHEIDGEPQPTRDAVKVVRSRGETETSKASQ